MNKRPRVLIYMPFYSGECESRHARMHDVIHYMNRLEDLGFDYIVLAERGKHRDSPRVSYTRLPFLQRYAESYTRIPGNRQTVLLLLQATVWNICRKLTIVRSRKVGAVDVFHIVRPNATSQAITRILLRANPNLAVIIGPNMMGYRALAQDFKLSDFQHHYIKRFISISSHHKVLMENFGIRGDVIDRLPPTVDPHYFYPTKERQCYVKLRIFYSAAQLAEEKGVSRFLMALRQLREEEGIEFEVKIAGSEQVNTSVQRPFDRSLLAGLEHHVTFVGKVDRSNIAHFLSTSDVFVHAGDVENGPTTLIEALSCGTPCILPNNLCFREPELEQDCIYFPPGSVEGLSHAIREFHAKWKEGRIRAATYLPQTTHADTVDFLRTLYQKVSG